MNPYVKNLNRIEFIVTLACTGRCKHCSEGEHTNCRDYIDGDTAVGIVKKICEKFRIQSLMTFGGEPLLYPDVVCKIHSAGKAMNIPQRQIITNGFFSKNIDKINETVSELAESGVNDVLLSVDVFHQETIPLETVKIFAEAVKKRNIPIKTHPAWLKDSTADNPYNRKTSEILKEFENMGIESSEGNIIFPSGNALEYLGEYFDSGQKQDNPYVQNPEDIQAVSISQNGDVLDGNVYQTDIMSIIENYMKK